MKIPETMGFVMDGNRRWAKEQGLLALKGHHEGGETLKKVTTWARDAGIKHVIFYTFSTENWKRTEEEVTYLLNLIAKYIEDELEHFLKEGGVLKFVGDLSRFSPKLQKIMREAEEKTANNAGVKVYFALNYGGRQEILSAVKSIIKENPSDDEITEEYFSKHLQTSGMPDPDVIVRTGGAKRLSGFLPWQGVYSELFFIDTYWPAFSKEEFDAILREYGERERRFGK